METKNDRPLAIVTGAATGIGLELARCCARNGFDLLIAADEAEIEAAAEDLRATSAAAEVEPVLACLLPSGMLAEQHRRTAEPGSAKT